MFRQESNMPVQMGWLVENRIVILRFEGIISDTDIDAMDEYVTRCYDNAVFPMVHLIADTRAITTQSNLKKLLRMKCVRHARRGWTITIGALHNATSRFIVGAITSMFSIRHRDVEDLDLAIEVLQRSDPALPRLQLPQLLIAEFEPQAQ
jgi:hypothetical protein